MTSNYSYETNPRIFTLFLFYLRSRRESFSQLEETLRTLFLFFFFSTTSSFKSDTKFLGSDIKFAEYKNLYKLHYWKNYQKINM